MRHWRLSCANDRAAQMVTCEPVQSSAEIFIVPVYLYGPTCQHPIAKSISPFGKEKGKQRTGRKGSNYCAHEVNVLAHGEIIARYWGGTKEVGTHQRPNVGQQATFRRIERNVDGLGVLADDYT